MSGTSIPEPPATSPSPAFPNTLWSAVLHALDDDQTRSLQALERLCHHYRPAIQNWFRRAGLTGAEADDQAQQFIARHFGPDGLLHFRPSGARFRAWLLVCLRHQWIDHHRRRDPELEPLDDLELPDPNAASPDGLELDRDIARVMDQHAMAATAQLWQDRSKPFHALSRFLFINPEPGEYARLAHELGMSANQVKSQVFQLRNDYAVAFHAEVRQICLPGDDAGEMRHLLALVPRISP